MKKVIKILIFILILSGICFSSNFDITPITYNFEGITSSNDTIIAYGTFGSAVISYDGGENWIQKRIFKGGTIIKIFFKGKDIIAFGQLGEIAISSEDGSNWAQETNLNDTILAVIAYSDGYLIRTSNNLFTLDNNLHKNSVFVIKSKAVEINNMYYKPDFRNSIIEYKNNFIVEMDSSVFIRLNKSLVPLDTLSLSKLGLFDSTFQYYMGYYLAADTSTLYFKLITTNSKRIYSYIYKTYDFKTAIEHDSLYALFSLFKMYDNKLFLFNKNEKFLIDSTKFIRKDTYTRIRKHLDFNISNNKLFIVGNGKFLEKFDLVDSSLNVISDGYDISASFIPDKISDSSFLFYSTSMSWGLGPYVSRTDNDGFTFRPVVDISNYKNNLGFYYNRYHFKLIENNGAKIILGGTNENDYGGYLLVSTDTCNTFNKIKKPTLNFGSYPGYLNAPTVPNINIGNNWYSMASWSVIYNYNDNFDRTSYIKDTTVIFDYVHTKDTNSYLVHCAVKTDSTSEIRYTSDRGQSWELIKKFPMPETESHYDEITVNNIKYFAIVHSNLYERMRNPDATVVSSVDIVNLENNECRRIFYWKSPNGEPEYGTMGIGITSDSNFAYIAFQDSLFVIPDFNDKSKWKYYLMPTPGSRMIRPIKKFGDRFYGRYADEYNPWAGYSAWFKPMDTLMNFPVSVDDTEINTYLTYSTPYPIPASNIVHAEIFWDMRYDIDNSDIAVYDYKGLKVEVRKSLTLDRKNAYSGVLSWDCAGYESGVYFVLLRHGETTRTIPIVVGK